MKLLLSHLSWTLLSVVLASSPQQIQSSRQEIHLSYLTHLGSNEIVDRLQDNLQNSLKSSQASISLDVSSSKLGNEGLLSILDSLSRQDEEKIVNLEARFNQISPFGAATFLERIMDLHNITNAIDDTTSTMVDDEEFLDTKMESDLQMQNKVYFDSVDLSLNDIGNDYGQEGKKAVINLHKALRKLVENELSCCPSKLRLDNCGFGAASCRAIGKGLLNREQHSIQSDRTLKELYMCGNDLGNGGIAALAAAMKSLSEKNGSVLEVLDVSDCAVGDAGLSALALAFEKNPGCIMNLDLSNNDITDESVVIFAEALINGHKKQPNGSYCIDSIDLSNNDIGDEGAEALFDAVECGAIRSLSLRSCSMKWRGCAALGTTIAHLLSKHSNNNEESPTIEIYISGNQIGKKEKKKKASVQANVMNSMNFLQKKLRSGLKDVGLVGSSLESDDEVEMMDSMGSEFADEQSSASKCGASELYKILAQELKNVDESHEENTCSLMLGMRMCNMDERGVDALCAISSLLGQKVKIDCRMNVEEYEEEILQSLRKGDSTNEALLEIAEQFIETMARMNEFESSEDDFGNWGEDDSYDDNFF